MNDGMFFIGLGAIGLGLVSISYACRAIAYALMDVIKELKNIATLLER